MLNCYPSTWIYLISHKNQASEAWLAKLTLLLRALLLRASKSQPLQLHMPCHTCPQQSCEAAAKQLLQEPPKGLLTHNPAHASLVPTCPAASA